MKTFTELSKIDVGEFIEKKGRFSYLSWCDAATALLKEDAKATWTYGEPQMWGGTVIVFCTVTAFEKSMTAQLPVMDNKNKAIKDPNAFDVNTAMQRCLAKAIALHGIGLYIYRGEDFPTDEEPQHQPSQTAPSDKAAQFKHDAIKAIQTYTTIKQIDDYLKLKTASIDRLKEYGDLHDEFYQEVDTQKYSIDKGK